MNKGERKEGDKKIPNSIPTKASPIVSIILEYKLNKNYHDDADAKLYPYNKVN